MGQSRDRGREGHGRFFEFGQGLIGQRIVRQPKVLDGFDHVLKLPALGRLAQKPIGAQAIGGRHVRILCGC